MVASTFADSSDHGSSSGGSGHSSGGSGHSSGGSGHSSGGSGHSSGGSGHSSGGSGHSSGGSGHDSGHDSGHESGQGGSGRGKHGLGGGFGKRARNRFGVDLDRISGHTSGEHTDDGTGRRYRHSISGGHYFGAGWLGGSRHVPDGIGGDPQSGLGNAQFRGLAGGGRGFGFWGGRGDDGGGDDDGGGGDNDPPTGTDVVPTTIFGTSGSALRTGDIGEELSCERYAFEKESGKKRLSGNNLRRLKLAGRLISPSYTSDAHGYAGFAERQLAYYQEHVERNPDDTTLAGTYLGLIAESPIEPDLISRIDRTLCVAADEQRHEQIAKIAESQRTHLKQFVGLFPKH